MRVTSIDARLFLETIALVPAGTVLRPRSHAHPAELVLALLASHMAGVSLDEDLEGPNSLAATILLNRRLAFGALLGMSVQPVCSLRVVGTLLLPQLDNLAQHWSVVGSIPATETKVVPALARDSGDQLIEHAWWSLRTLDSKFASGMWTPA